MKLALLVFNFIHDDGIRSLLQSLNVPGFTEIPQVYGTGESGKRFGTHAFPGHDTLIFSVLADNQAETLADALERIKARLGDRRKPGGVKLFVMNIERVV